MSFTKTHLTQLFLNSYIFLIFLGGCVFVVAPFINHTFGKYGLIKVVISLGLGIALIKFSSHKLFLSVQPFFRGELDKKDLTILTSKHASKSVLPQGVFGFRLYTVLSSLLFVIFLFSGIVRADLPFSILHFFPMGIMVGLWELLISPSNESHILLFIAAVFADGAIGFIFGLLTTPLIKLKNGKLIQVLLLLSLFLLLWICHFTVFEFGRWWG